jgi:shikimate kinase
VSQLVLLGLMGSGKSSVAAALARRTGAAVLDNDALLEDQTGADARRLEEWYGSDWLHRQELEIVRAALDRPGPVVITAAASVADREAAAEVLAPATVVWLRTEIDTLVERVSGDRDSAGDHRPERGDVREMLIGQVEGRSPRYRALADVVVDTDDVTPDEVAARILIAVDDLERSGVGSISSSGPDDPSEPGR